MEKVVGINQRISVNVIEMAMKASLDGIFTPEFASDLASGEYQGANRINKARSIIGKLTQRNPLFPFILSFITFLITVFVILLFLFYLLI